MTDFKPGDRVRVIYEGEVVDSHSSLHLKVKTAEQFYLPFLNDPAVTIEKIVEPEPEWRQGDVVKAPDYYPFMYDEGVGWRGAKGNWSQSFDDAVSDAWERGELKILHKARA